MDTTTTATDAASKHFLEATKYNTRVSAPTLVVLLGVRESRRQERRMLLADGKCPAISAAERRAEVARCYLSKLTGKLIEEEQQLSAAVTIDGGTYKATIDTWATASFIRKELADNLVALGKITRIRRQVRLADGRCGGIEEQLEVEIARTSFSRWDT